MAVSGQGTARADGSREPDRGRRRFLGATALTLAASQFAGIARLAANQREPRQIAALRRATAWLNGSAPSATTLAGSVVVVQFGTYTCINWLRTLPFVRAWHQKYPRLAIVGVHTPEFSFEKRLENVRHAVARLNLGFPIAVDSDYAIWRAFDNRYWPALYFLDARGRLRGHHFGEGEYERSERTIQELLAEAGHSGAAPGVVPFAASGVELQADWASLKTPETYLGYERTERFSSRGGAELGRRRRYAAPARLARNEWALAGEWTVAEEAAMANEPLGRIVCRFHARDVHLVMGPLRAEHRVRFRVSIEGERPGPAHGVDTDEDGSGTVVEQRLYQLVRQPGPVGDRTFAIEFLDAGVEAFAFTFG